MNTKRSKSAKDATKTAEEEIPEFVQRAVAWGKGRNADEFSLGDKYPHHWGRTINAGDNSLFTTLTQTYNPLYFNEPYAQAQGHPKILVNPLLVFNTIFGLSVEDLSENTGVFISIEKCKFHQHVYVDDTLSAESEVLAKRESKSNPANHIVTWHTSAYNQKDELVMEYVRSNLLIDGLMQE